MVQLLAVKGDNKTGGKPFPRRAYFKTIQLINWKLK